MTTEPTLAATREAAEQVRAANHAAYDAPKGDPVNVYDRAGAVHALLTSAEQLVDDLARHAERLTESPGLESTDGADGVPAASHARRAAQRLLQASQSVARAKQAVNLAWGELSPLYVRLADEDGETR